MRKDLCKNVLHKLGHYHFEVFSSLHDILGGGQCSVRPKGSEGSRT